jgi:hypothetical protein
MTLGLRSTFLDVFDVFEERNIPKSMFMPCDVFGLVPIVGLMCTKLNIGLEAGAIDQRDSGTYAILTFVGRSQGRVSWEKDLAQKVSRFMKQWTKWVEVLENILGNDLAVGDWDVDWREFLAGVTGYTPMPWFPALTVNEWSTGIESITSAAKALLVSVLNHAELTSDPIVNDVLSWLDQMRPTNTIRVYPRQTVGGMA